MNCHDTLIEVADDWPVSAAEVPHARGGKKTKAVVEYQQLVETIHTYAKGIAQASAPAKRFGWGLHDNAEGNIR